MSHKRAKGLRMAAFPKGDGKFIPPGLSRGQYIRASTVYTHKVVPAVKSRSGTNKILLLGSCPRSALKRYQQLDRRKPDGIRWH